MDNKLNQNQTNLLTHARQNLQNTLPPLLMQDDNRTQQIKIKCLQVNYPLLNYPRKRLALLYTTSLGSETQDNDLSALSALESLTLDILSAEAYSRSIDYK